MARDLIGVELGPSGIFAVALRCAGSRRTLLRAGHLDFGEDQDLKDLLSASVGWLQEWVRSFPAGTVIAGIPLRDYLCRTAKIPRASGRMLDDLVDYEVKAVLPEGGEDHTLGWEVIDSSSNGACVAVASARTDSIEVVAEWLARSGARSSQVAFGTAGRLAIALAQSHRSSIPCAVIFEGHWGAEVVWRDASGRWFARAARPGEGVTADQLVDDLQRVLTTEEDGTMARTIVRCGSTRELVDLLAEDGRSSPSSIDWGECRTESSVSDGAQLSDCVGALGLVLHAASRRPGKCFRHVACEPQRSPAQQSSWTRWAMGASVLVTTLAAGVVSPWNPMSLSAAAGANLAQNERRLSELSGVGGKTATTNRDSVPALPDVQGVSSNLHEESSQVLGLLRELTVKLPSDVVLSELSLQKGQTALLRGTAESNESVARSLVTVRSLPRFTGAHLGFSNQSTRDGRERFEFEIMATLPRGAAARGAGG